MITLTYINHLNESIVFNSNGLFMTSTELHNYKWNYSSNNNRISYFSKGIVDSKTKVVIANNDREEAIKTANQLMECTEKDVVANKAGRLYFNDYYVSCFITSSKKTNYDEKKGMLEIELTITTDSPSWTKETNNNFSTSASGTGKNLDFSFDFPYDFASSSNTNKLINLSYAETDFKLIIYGETTNPVINIGGHSYGVNCYIAQNEYLVVDSKEKTITLVKNNGQQLNYFRYRDKDNYIFQKIEAGEQTVTWSGEFVFDIILFEERSEPKWT